MPALPTPPLPSNKKFGWIFCAVFFAFGTYLAWRQSLIRAIPLFALAVSFGALAHFAPRLLQPLNRLWYQFGIALGKITSPIVLGIIYFLLITPVAIVTRIAGRNALRLRQHDVTTFWILRSPPGPKPESFSDQF